MSAPKTINLDVSVGRFYDILIPNNIEKPSWFYLYNNEQRWKRYDLNAESTIEFMKCFDE